MTTNLSTVRVTELAGDTHTLDHDTQSQVGHYLEEAGIDLPLSDGSVITMNGEIVSDEALVEPNAVIVVTSRIRNG